MVLELLSGFAGDFVVSTAGPDLESVIAGQGSGAWEFSEENGTVVVNLDIGGGTTNVVLFDGGEVRARGCLDIGGRQVTLDSRGRIAYISPSAGRIAQACHLNLVKGEPVSVETLNRLCDKMSEVLEQMLGVAEPTPLLEEVRTQGSALFKLPADRPVRFRATVIGAGNYTTTISGSTISYTEGLFPMKNVPVLKLTLSEEERCWGGDSKFLYEKIKWFLAQNDAACVVLAMEGRRDPDYQELKKLAAVTADALDRALLPEVPLLLMVRSDIAKALGQIIRQKLSGKRPLVAVDAVKAEFNNFVDFGRPIMNGLVIPVIVKTLIFG